MTEYMTPMEIAKALRISKMSVYRMIHSGELSHVKVGTQYRVFKTSFEALVRKGTNE